MNYLFKCVNTNYGVHYLDLFRVGQLLKKAECLVEGLKGVARSRSLEFNDDEAAPPQKKHSGASNEETSTAQVSLSGALEKSHQLSHSSQLLPEASVVRSVPDRERLPSPVVVELEPDCGVFVEKNTLYSLDHFRKSATEAFCRLSSYDADESDDTFNSSTSAVILQGPDPPQATQDRPPADPSGSPDTEDLCRPDQ
ncbi:hypothetical protein MTO96_034802 [Rhipicephalus appendiculatus]